MKTVFIRIAAIAALGCLAALSFAGLNKVWDIQFGRDSFSGRGCVRVDGSGNVYVLASEALPYGAVSSALHYYLSKVVVYKFNAPGKFQWSRSFSDPQKTWETLGIRLDSAGNVYAVCRGGPAADPTQPSPHLILKFDPAGKLAWYRESLLMGNLSCFCVDGKGNTYLAGEDYNSREAITTVRTLKIGSDGKDVWTNSRRERLGDGFSRNDYAKDIDVDSAGNVYTAVSSYQAFVQKYNPSGGYLRSTMLPAPGATSSEARRLKVASDDTVIAVSSSSAGEVTVSHIDKSGAVDWRYLSHSTYPASVDLQLDQANSPSVLYMGGPARVLTLGSNGAFQSLITLGSVDAFSLTQGGLAIDGNGNRFTSYLVPSLQCTQTFAIPHGAASVLTSNFFPAKNVPSLAYDTYAQGTNVYVLGNRFDLPGGPMYLLKLDSSQLTL